MNLPFTKDEIEKVTKSVLKNRSTGPDDVAIELIQDMDDLGVGWIITIANKIYDEGHFPLDMRRTTFIALPKKPGTAKCEIHRTISLMSHIAKLIFKIRVRGRIEGVISEEQFGFAEDKGTRNAIFMLQIIGEGYIEMQREVYICYIDYVKAFDEVQHKHLFRILEWLKGQESAEGKEPTG